MQRDLVSGGRAVSDELDSSGWSSVGAVIRRALPAP